MIFIADIYIVRYLIIPYAIDFQEFLSKLRWITND